MPKKIYQLKDFSGGLNNLQDPADIANNQVSTSKGFMYNLQGVIQPAYSMALAANKLTAATYSNEKIVSVEPGYGFGYFETDFVRDAVIKEVTTVNNSGGSEAGFKQDLTTSALSMKVGGSAVNLTTSYAVGTRVLITAPAFPSNSIDMNGQGIYTVVGHSSNDIILDRNITISVESSQVYWAATVKGYPSGDKIFLLANPSDHTIDVFSSRTATGTILTVDDLTPSVVGGAWTASQSHTGITGTSNTTGSGLTCSIATDGSGDPTFTITNGGSGYVVDEEITFTDPDAGTSNTAVLIVATTSKWTQDTISLRSTASGLNSKVSYHKIDDAIRCFDTTDRNDSKVQWYGWIDRRHFQLLPALGGSTTDDNAYLGYYAKDNTLSPPSEDDLTSASTTSPANFTTYPASAGTGFELNVISHTDVDGLIRSGVYEFASTFIYDGNQESLPFKYTNTHTISEANDFKVLSLNVTATSPFDPRISGGRIYIREVDANEEWVMLIDIDLTKGCRKSLSDVHTSWHDAGSSHFNCPTATASANFEVKDLGFITYETINGFPSSIYSHALGDQGEFWKDSTVSNNRAFICNVTMKDEESGISKATSSVKNYPDRIMYSMSNRFDTFPSFNFIEAAKGDADYYVAIESFADRLLAFKLFSLDIINISSPSDANWFLETSKQYQGVEHPEAVKRTQYGIVWANTQGLFIYGGSTIKNLSENVIADATWASHITATTGIIYDEQESMVFVISSMSTNGDAYMCDLRKGSFSFIKDFVLDTNDGITNSVDTEDNNTYYVHDGGSITDIYKIVRSSVTHNDQEVITKNIDFGDSSTLKKVYAVYVTYKSDIDISAKVFYSVDSGANWVATSGPSATATTWAHGKWTISSPPSTSKVLIKVDTGGASKVYINDIGIEYRELYKRMG